ncbi:hypothetical protein F511_23863 [Dorcoceras hygrometricum]|uniref:Uncharacterized protein n=1 Tax=Dorcoceras hygrometricum TaxID=472368 RepID=A0A2Z7CY43_9LAMI|nr:hypothetical protein F511_23863 [Dorcoceras hygrometricum]
MIARPASDLRRDTIAPCKVPAPPVDRITMREGGSKRSASHCTTAREATAKDRQPCAGYRAAACVLLREHVGAAERGGGRMI